MSLIRVLHVVTKMDRAGLENRLMDLYREIDKNNIQFDFFTCSEEKGYYDAEINNLGGKIYYSKNISMMSFKNVMETFGKILSDNPEYDIVHCHLNQWCGLILRKAKKEGVSVRIAHSRTSLEKLNVKNVIKNILKLPTNKYSTHKMAVSDKAATWLFGKDLVKKNQVTILPNAIDFKKFQFDKQIREEYRAEYGFEDNIVLIHVGNIRKEKNHPYLIKIFKDFKENNNNAKLVIIGKDNQDGKIQKIVENNKLEEDVLFLGSRSDVSSWLSAADVFVFPSYYEGFPGSVIEAQSTGLPCIISDNITSEVCITDRIIQLPINIDVNEWSTRICLINEKFKNQRALKFENNKYSIEHSTKLLTEFYIDALQ